MISASDRFTTKNTTDFAQRLAEQMIEKAMVRRETGLNSIAEAKVGAATSNIACPGGGGGGGDSEADQDSRRANLALPVDTLLPYVVHNICTFLSLDCA